MSRRSSANGGDNAWSPNKPKKKSSKVCAICKTKERHLHRVVEVEAPLLRKWYDLDISTDDRICCRHFEPHASEIFKAKSRPRLLKDMTAYRSSKSLRKDPPTNSPRVAKKPAAPTVKELQERVDALEAELAAIKRRPYDVIFNICASRSKDGTAQLLGMILVVLLCFVFLLSRC